MRRLSVFAGSWTLEEAEVICADPPEADIGADAVDTLDVLDLLTALASKSLVIAETDGAGATRYRLLETIRQYARDRLLEADEAEQTRFCHAAHFLSLAEIGGPALKGPDLMPWMRRLEPDLDNFRSALEWNLERDPAAGLRLASALEMYWVFIGRILSEGRDWLSRLLERTGPPPDDGEAMALYARGLAVQARLSQGLGDYRQTLQQSEKAAKWARRAGDHSTLAMALSLSCFTAGVLSDSALAEKAGEEVLALTRDGAYPWDRATAIVGLAQAAVRVRNDLETGRAYHAEISRLARVTGSPFMMGQVEWGAGILEATSGDPAIAARHLAEGIRLFREMGLSIFAYSARSDLAHLLRRQGNLDAARAHYRETIRAWQTLGSILAVAHQLESFAFLAVADGGPARAARLLAAATALREPVGGGMLPDERREYDSALEAARQALGGDAFDPVWAAGRALDMNAAVEYALSES